MIIHVWTVVCSRSIQDAESRNISLIDVIEQINVGQPLPARGEVKLAPISLDVVTLWARNPGSTPAPSRARVVMVSPGGTELGHTVYSVDLTGSIVRLRSATRIAGIPIVEEGFMMFRVELEVPGGTWEKKAEVPIQVAVLGTTSDGTAG